MPAPPAPPPARQPAQAPTIAATTERTERERARMRGYAGMIMTPQGGQMGMPPTAGRSILGG